jgi:hypothetical protein
MSCKNCGHKKGDHDCLTSNPVKWQCLKCDCRKFEPMKPCSSCGKPCELGICEDCANVAFD